MTGVWRLLMAGLLVLAAGVRSLALEARMSVDREVIEEGETFMLLVSVEGTQQSSTPVLPPIPGLRSRYLGPSSQVVSVNGQTSVQVTHRFLMKPDTGSEVVLPPLTVRVGAQSLQTGGARVRLLPATQRTEPVWVKLIVDRSDVVVGETFPVELQLYYQSIRDPSAPRFDLDGFVVGRNAQPTQAVTQRDGQTWSVVVWRFAVTATKPGELAVGPAEVDLTLLTETPGGRRPGSIFDDFFGPPREARRLTVKSERHPLKVTAPPGVGRPAGFAGAIGRFRLKGVVSPGQVALGDPATVRLTVEGEGSIETVDLPAWPEMAGLRVYPGTNGFTPGDSLGLTGSRTIEYVVVPERTGRMRLPIPPLVAFDPESRRYESVAAPELTLDVVPGRTPALASSGPGDGSGTNAPVLAGAAPMLEWRSTSGNRPVLGVGWASARWLPVVFAVPWAGWVCVALVGVVRRRRANRPAGPIRDQWLAESRHCLRDAVAGSAEEVPALARAVRCRIGWWLDRSPEGIGAEVVEQDLRPRGMGAEACDAAAEWFAEYDQLRFAPGHGGAPEGFRARTERLLAMIEKEPSR